MVTDARLAKPDAPRTSLAGRYTPGLVRLALLAALAGCRTPSASTRPTFRAEIEARNAELEQLFRSGDLLGVADAYADDAFLIDAHGERTVGREEIDAYWSSIESPIDWSLAIRSLRGAEGVAYEFGTSRMTVLRDGALHTTVREFLMLWRREGGGPWRIAADASWPKKPR